LLGDIARLQQSCQFRLIETSAIQKHSLGALVGRNRLLAGFVEVTASVYWQDTVTERTTLSVHRGDACDSEWAQPTLLIWFGEDTL
jgi:hypothetical protein